MFMTSKQANFISKGPIFNIEHIFKQIYHLSTLGITEFSISVLITDEHSNNEVLRTGEFFKKFYGYDFYLGDGKYKINSSLVKNPKYLVISWGDK